MKNMQPISNEEVKKIELNILKHIKKVCDDNDIRYTLVFGTLLGAVRHQGFIPWDDDIDIGVPWNDYLKLMEALEKDDKYVLKYDMTCKGFTYFHAKLTDPKTVVFEKNKPKSLKIGVWVDIFPISGIPEEIETKEYLSMLDNANKKVAFSIRDYWRYDQSFLKSLIKILVRWPVALYLKLFGENHWKKLRRKLYVMQDFATAKMVGIVPCIYGEKSIYSSALFDKYTMLKFEDDEFSVIAEYDQYLRLCYGDYMQLPPENKRKPEHFEAFYN